MRRIFTLFLLLAAVVAPMWAQSLRVGGVSVNLNATSTQTITGANITGSVTYNPNSKTLYLKDANIEGGISGSNLGSSGSDRFFIYLTGNNSITSTTMGMRFDDSYVVLYGGSLDSKLYINCSQNRSDYSCIDTESGHFEVWGINLSMDGNGSGFWGNSSKGTLSFVNTYANINCKAGAIVKCSRVSFDDAKVITSGVKHDSSKGYVDGSGNVVAELAIRPLLMVGSEPVRTRGDSQTGTGWTWTKGTKTLNITGDINGYALFGIANYGVSGLTINTDVTANVTSGDVALFTYEDLSLTGSGTLKLSSSLSDALCSDGGTLTIKMKALEAKGKYFGVRADNLKLEAYNSATVYKFAGAEVVNVYARNLEMNGIDIAGPETYWNPGNGWVFYQNAADRSTTVTNGTWFKSVEQIAYYNLWIADIHVREENTKYLMSRYLKGNVAYDASSKTLSLDNVTIDYQGSASSYHAIKADGITGLKINVKGNNTLTGNENLFAALWERNGAGIELSGDGTLNLGGGYGAYLYGSSLTVGDNVTLIAQKNVGSNASSSSNYGSLTVKGNAVVKAQKILGLNALTLQGGRAIVQPSGAVFSENAVRLNGALAENVVIQEDVEYGLRFYDSFTQHYIDISTSNAADVLGDGRVSFDADTRTLTLNNAHIYGRFWNQKVEDLKINIVGACSAVNNDGGITPTLKTKHSATFVGTGTLNIISTSEGGVFNIEPDQGEEATLTFDGPEVLVAVDGRKCCFYGPGSTTLCFLSGKFTYEGQGVPINIMGNVVLGEGMYITEPYGATFDDYNAIRISSSYLYTGKFVVSSQEPDAVDGIKAAEDAPAGIYDIAGRRMEQTQRGINILRTAEGKARKVVVK